MTFETNLKKDEFASAIQEAIHHFEGVSWKINSYTNKAPRTCIITGKGMHEGYLLHTGETIADESSLLVYLKTNYKEGVYSDDFILADAYEQELYLWTDWHDE
mgnify:CR=1 FL=1